MTNKYLVFHSIITGLKPENKNAYETSVFCCGAQAAGGKMISGRYGISHEFVHSRYENRLHFFDIRNSEILRKTETDITNKQKTTP